MEYKTEYKTECGTELCGLTPTEVFIMSHLRYFWPLSKYVFDYLTPEYKYIKHMLIIRYCEIGYYDKAVKYVTSYGNYRNIDDYFCAVCRGEHESLIRFILNFADRILNRNAMFRMITDGMHELVLIGNVRLYKYLLNIIGSKLNDDKHLIDTACVRDKLEFVKYVINEAKSTDLSILSGFQHSIVYNSFNTAQYTLNLLNQRDNNVDIDHQQMISFIMYTDKYPKILGLLFDDAIKKKVSVSKLISIIDESLRIILTDIKNNNYGKPKYMVEIVNVLCAVARTIYHFVSIDEQFSDYMD